MDMTEDFGGFCLAFWAVLLRAVRRFALATDSQWASFPFADHDRAASLGSVFAEDIFCGQVSRDVAGGGRHRRHGVAPNRQMLVRTDAGAVGGCPRAASGWASRAARRLRGRRGRVCPTVEDRLGRAALLASVRCARRRAAATLGGARPTRPHDPRTDLAHTCRTCLTSYPCLWRWMDSSARTRW